MDADPRPTHQGMMADYPAFQPPRNVAGGLRSYVEALLAVVVATLVGLAITPRWGTSAVDLLYLPAVLSSAIRGGLRPALLCVLASVLAYNFFFIAPYGTFRVANFADFVTITVFFLVAVVASQLTASVHKQARLAAAHAARNATIAGLARQLLSCATEEEIARVVADQFAALFRCNASFVVRRPDLSVLASVPAHADLEATDVAAAMLAIESGKSAGRAIERGAIAEWQFHPVRSQSTNVAAVGLARDDGAPPIDNHQALLLNSLLDQVALALDRASVESAARDFAASRAQDRMRATLLATIAEDLTPSVRGLADTTNHLRRSGEADRELVTELAKAATRLTRYVDNLHSLDFETDQQPLAFGQLQIDFFKRLVRKEGTEVHLPPKEYAVLAELAKHPGRVLSHAHLLRAVWGPAHERQIDYLRVAIRSLRQKLEDDPARPQLILNEPAVGYRLKPD